MEQRTPTSLSTYLCFHQWFRATVDFYFVSWSTFIARKGLWLFRRSLRLRLLMQLCCLMGSSISRGPCSTMKTSRRSHYKVPIMSTLTAVRNVLISFRPLSRKYLLLKTCSFSRSTSVPLKMQQRQVFLQEIYWCIQECLTIWSTWLSKEVDWHLLMKWISSCRNQTLLASVSFLIVRQWQKESSRATNSHRRRED